MPVSDPPARHPQGLTMAQHLSQLLGHFCMGLGAASPAQTPALLCCAVLLPLLSTVHTAEMPRKTPNHRITELEGAHQQLVLDRTSLKITT